jgi:hypothetical protein
MSFVVEEDVAPDPGDISLFGTDGVVLEADGLADRSAELTAKPGRGAFGDVFLLVGRSEGRAIAGSEGWPQTFGDNSPLLFQLTHGVFCCILHSADRDGMGRYFRLNPWVYYTAKMPYQTTERGGYAAKNAA